MRQNDGSEILGPNDPRNLVIGIIHVSPNDDRQSVITAIATQDKLGRDQIVLDLPAQNKSFKGAVDFEGLRHMVNDIEGTLVVIAPERSKVAGLARKEHFTVYPSLEELASAEYPPLETEEMEGVANGAEEETTRNAVPVEDDEADHAMLFPIAVPSSENAGASPEAPAAARVPSPPAAVPAQAAPGQASVPTAYLSTLDPVQGQSDEDEVPTDPSFSTLDPRQEQPDEDEAPTDPSLPTPATVAQTAGSDLPTPSSALVPSNAQLPVYYEPLDVPPQRSWRGWIIAGVTLLLLIALGVFLYRPVLDFIFPPTATVTLVPDSQRLQHTYQMVAVLGLPDPSKNQVDARALYANAQSQSQTVKATGQGHIAGQPAHGVLTFYNTSTTSQTIQAGTVIFASDGVAVVNDDTIMLPALDPSAGLGSTTDSAHTVNVGNGQNIPANAFNNQLCCGGGIYVSNNEAFSGGQDAQTYTYVQQSDIDVVVQALSAPLTRQAAASLQEQVRSNEKSAGTPRCAPQARSNHQAGDRADTVTVMVMISCVGEVYDMQAVQVVAARKLTQDANVNPGPAYVPVGQILAQVAQATPDNHGNIVLVVNAVGIWAYQFTNVQLAHLTSLISGKSSQDAKHILLGETGVHGVAIALTGVGVTVLPGNIHQIAIHVEAVEGLHLPSTS